MDELKNLLPQLRKTLSGCVPGLSIEKSNARREWLISLVQRFKYAAQKDVPDEQVEYLAFELDLCQYPESAARAVEDYILRGWPAKRGYIVLPDFFPSVKELAEFGSNIFQIVRAEYARGFSEGERQGYDKAMNDFFIKHGEKT